LQLRRARKQRSTFILTRAQPVGFQSKPKPTSKHRRLAIGSAQSGEAVRDRGKLYWSSLAGERLSVAPPA
jgi:hypothetical protein